MTTTDHRAEAEREIDMVTSGNVTDEEGIRDAVTVALMHGVLAIHDELRAIRDHVVPTPKEPEPSPGVTPSTETERILSALCDQLREESTARLSLLMKAERQAEALAEEVDGLRSELAVDLDTIERLRARLVAAEVAAESLRSALEDEGCDR